MHPRPKRARPRSVSVVAIFFESANWRGNCQLAGVRAVERAWHGDIISAQTGACTVAQRRVTVPAPRRARYNDVEEDFCVAHVLDLTLENPARPPPDHRSTASTPPPSRWPPPSVRSARTCRGDRRTGRACACRARPGAEGRHAHITDVGWAARQVGMPAVGPRNPTCPVIARTCAVCTACPS